jgi:hypothetical protein
LFLEYIIPNFSTYTVTNPTYSLKQMKLMLTHLKSNEILLKHSELRNNDNIPLTFFSFILSEILNVVSYLIPLQEEYNRLLKIENELS